MNVSVILSTYEEPAWLEKVLWGYAVQTRGEFQMVVADDGSGPETRAVIDRFREATARDVVHVWQEDRGFRKCEVLNRAVLAASGEYLVFSDGDCIPRDDFVETHARLAAPGVFLSGGPVRLPRALSERISLDDVRQGRFADPAWLRSQGWEPGRRRLRLLRSPTAAAWADRLTTTRATWNGSGASTWREAVLAVNGFDHEMGYGGEDRAFGERLVNLGYRGRQVRHRAVCLHLEHDRPYVTADGIRRIRQARRTIRGSGDRWTPRGIAELDSGGSAGAMHARQEEG
jgi:glycosyltransferase involved in cell wall biosynthesis